MALFRERLAELAELGIQGLEFLADAFQFGVAALEGVEFLPSLGAEGEDFFDGTTVFALERLEQVQSLLQLRQPLRIQVNSVGIAGEFALEIPKNSRGLCLKIDQRLCAGIDSGQVL